MKKIFYIGYLGLLITEVLQVYLLMPMPGSQEMNSIDLAYFLYTWRWLWRVGFSLLLLVGLVRGQWKRKWPLALLFTFLLAILYMMHVEMTASALFKQPQQVRLVPASQNTIEPERLVLGVVVNGVARAYPIQIIAYHHFVYDTQQNFNLLATYCTVCRTGRIFEASIQGKVENFRLVGMDHFNALIEDASTHSWWRQSTGEAIVGKRKGQNLKEIYCQQTSLAQWLKLYPHSYILQADSASMHHYDTSFRYEKGKSKSKLTGTDSLSWQKKSWVIGVKYKDANIAFDWNTLLKKRVVQKVVKNTAICVVLAQDNTSFFAFENPSRELPQWLGDTLYLQNKKYNLQGVGIDTTARLKSLHAYQEFWHSWKTFHPNTEK